MSNVIWHPWKVATIGLAVVATTVLVTTLVVGNWNEKGMGQPAPAVSKGKPGQVAATPSAADIEACNKYAKSATTDKTTEAVKDEVIGGAIGAGVGATAGTLYGLNKASKQDARAVEAYRTCMRERGYAG